MARASYEKAIEWLASNDDNCWLEDVFDGSETMPSVSCCLVIDLFGKPEAVVIRDLKRAIKRAYA